MKKNRDRATWIIAITIQTNGDKNKLVYSRFAIVRIILRFLQL